MPSRGEASKGFELFPMTLRTHHLPRLSLGTALVAVLIEASSIAPLLQLDRATVWPHLWQLATCQLTHWSADHLLWDVIVFLALGSICECLDRRSLLRTLLLASLAVPAAVLLLCPEIALFRGLSGIDSALFGLLLARVFLTSRRDHDGLSLALVTSGGAIFLAKCLYETFTRDTLFVSAAESFAVVPVAHLVGFIVGIACAPCRLHGSAVSTASCVTSTIRLHRFCEAGHPKTLRSGTL